MTMIMLNYDILIIIDIIIIIVAVNSYVFIALLTNLFSYPLCNSVYIHPLPSLSSLPNLPKPPYFPPLNMLEEDSQTKVQKDGYE